MNLFFKIFLIIILCNSTIQTLSAQKLWPGDVNNNGIVSGVDFLYAAIAFGTDGPTRTNTSGNWEEKDITTLWADDFPNGLNFAYGDCDGNGKINDEDLEVIEDNFSKTHGTITPDTYNTSTGTGAPQVRLEVQNTNIQFGDEIEVKVLLGDGTTPIQDFYGISFKMNYSTGLTEPGEEWEFDFANNNWIDPAGNGEDVKSLIFNDETAGKAELSFARVNQSPVSGSGEVGSFFIIIEDYVVGRAEKDTLDITITDIILINENLSSVPMATDSIQIFVHKTLTSTTHTHSEEFVLFPNPSTNAITIEYPSQTTLEKVSLVDVLGRNFLCTFSYPNQGKMHVEWSPKIDAGMYFLLIKTNESSFTRKIHILKN